MRMIQRVCTSSGSAARVFLGLALLLTVQPALAQGTWSEKAPMPTPRGAHAIAVVNGIIYAIGGATTNGAPLSVVEAYDPASDTWSSKASLPFPIERAAAGSVNGIIYLVGGCADNACGALLNTVYAYDPATDTWTQKASIPTPRRDFAVGTLNGIIYAMGGNQGPGYVCLSSVEAYDPSTNTWTEKAPLPIGRVLPAAAVLNGTVYAIGGLTCNPVPNPGFLSESSELDSYDPVGNTWTTKASMPTAGGPAAGPISGIVYAVGGDIAPTLNQAYNTLTNTWSTAAPMPTSRIGPAAAVVNGTLYAIGGFSGVFVGTNEAFTPSAPLGQGTWITKTPMSTTRPSAVSVAIDGKLYVVGGNNGQTLASMEAYDPSTDAWTSLASLPQLDSGQPGRYGGAAAAIGGKLYLPGGWRTVPPLPTNTLLVYDPGSNSWSTKASMPSLSACSAAGAIDDKLYVLTACNGFSGYVSRLDIYDPGTDSWVGRASCPHVHSSPGAAVINGKFYVAGGFDGSQISGTLDVYDPATDSWTTKSSMPTARAGLGGDAIDGKFYAVGGSGVGGPLSALEIYDPSTNTWTSGPSMLTPRGGLVASAINGQLYAVGGGNNSGPLATNEVLIQNSPPDNDSGLAQLNGGNTFTGNQTVNGTVAATSFVGDGSGLTGVNAATATNAMNLGGVAAANYARLDIGNSFNGNQTVNGSVSATALSGNGSGLTNLSPANIASGTANISISGTAATATNALNFGGAAAANYARLDIGNSFNGNQTVNGSVTATALSGNGSGLTNLSPANIASGTANISISGTAATALNAINATNAASATNAANLGGVAAGNYARLDIDNNFTGNQTVAGNLSVSGNSTTTGSVTIGGGTPITKHLSMQFTLNVPGLKPSTCSSSTFTFTGASDGDTTALGVPNALMSPGMMIYSAWVSAANTIQIRACNVNPNGPPIASASGTVRVDIWKH